MTAAAATANTQIVNYREQLKRELAARKNQIPPPSGNRISLKGKQFTLPDGSSHAGPIACVILDWRYIHEYYTGAYDPNNPAAPVCWANSSDATTLAPGSSVPSPKHDNCAGCDMNAFGSAPTGRGKACKNQRRLAVVPVDATVDTDPMILMVSPTGLKNFDNLINGILAEDNMPIELVTHIGMNPRESYPTLVFARGEFLNDDQLAVMGALRTKAQAALDREPEPRD